MKMNSRKRKEIESEIVRGIEVNDGWLSILEKFYDYWITFKEKARKLGCEVEFFQFKQKFGGLRVYAYIENEGKQGEFEKEKEVLKQELRKEIQECEGLAEKTCEFCGSVNETVKARKPGDFWIFNICDECFVKQRKEEKNE